MVRLNTISLAMHLYNQVPCFLQINDLLYNFRRHIPPTYYFKDEYLGTDSHFADYER